MRFFSFQVPWVMRISKSIGVINREGAKNSGGKTAGLLPITGKHM